MHRLRISTPALLLALFAGMAIHSVQHKSLTYDEPAHIQYGQQVLSGNSDRFDDSKMPVTALNLLPSRLASWAPSQPLEQFLRRGQTTRYMTIFAGALLGLIVYLWSSQLWGPKGGLLSLLIYIFDPNILAHTRWVTTDVYGALGIVASLYGFHRWMTRGTWPTFLLFTLLTALAQAAKFSAVYLYPFYALVLGFSRYRDLKQTASARFWVRLLVFVLLTLGVINACYLFNGTFQSLSAYEFKSELFQSLQTHSGVLSHVPLPLPGPFIEGLDWTKFNEISGTYRGPAYLWGELRKEPFPNYFLYIFLFKTPIPVILMLLWAGIAAFRSPDADRRQVLAYVWLPMLFYFGYFNFLCRAQMGVRMILMIYPLIYVALGVLVRVRGRRLTLPLMVWMVISVQAFHPHYLSYSNEFIPQKKYAYRVFADSNLDWGQNGYYAKQYLEQHPDVRFNPPAPVTGKVLIPVNFLTGILFPGRHPWYGWIRENLEPVRHVDHAHLLYDIPPDALPAIREYLRENYSG